MTDIEDLLRDALATTPTPPTATDPLGTLDRRVRRARRRLAVGAGVVAAGIAAAVVVPLTVGRAGGSGQPGGVHVVVPATQGPGPTLPASATVLWTDHAIWTSTSSTGQSWLLYSDGDQTFVVNVSGKRETPIQVPGRADYVIAGPSVLWFIGGDDGQTKSTLSAIDPSTHQISSMSLSTTTLSFATVVGDTLYVDASDTMTGDAVDRIEMRAGDIKIVASNPLPHAAEMVATNDGHVWVHAGSHLVRLTPTPGGFDIGLSVAWGDGALQGAFKSGTSGEGVWAYDGDRLIGLSPVLLAGCVSCAEGYRVPVGGTPGVVVEQPEGIYVALVQGGRDAPGVYYYPTSSLGEGAPQPAADLPDVMVTTMAPDPSGGVDYVDDQGNLVHWEPVAR